MVKARNCVVNSLNGFLFSQDIDDQNYLINKLACKHANAKLEPSFCFLLRLGFLSNGAARTFKN